jgi:nucleotide-binding universal stress UspA family protein
LEGWTLRWAAEQAYLEGRRLELVNASTLVSPSAGEHGRALPRVGSTGPSVRKAAALDWARAELRLTAPYVEVDHVLRAADPRTLLIQLTASAHLMVLGSRGRGTVRSHLLGSLGLSVVRHAACPVVVHRPACPGQVHRGVVVAADATEESLPVLAFAFHLASLRHLPVRVAHFVHDARSATVVARSAHGRTEHVEQHQRLLAESLAGFREDYPDVPVSLHTPPGTPGDGIVRLSSEADLTVVGRHPRGLVGRLLAGSVAESVLQHGHGPIAVVPVAG